MKHITRLPVALISERNLTGISYGLFCLATGDVHIDQYEGPDDEETKVKQVNLGPKADELLSQCLMQYQTTKERVLSTALRIAEFSADDELFEIN